MPDELVLHYLGTNRLLGSPTRLDRAIALIGAVGVVGLAVTLATWGSEAANFALVVAGLSGLVALMLVYSRLRFANAGLFMAGGRVGVIDAFGRRRGVDASEVDHLQMCTLASTSVVSYGVLLLIGRDGRALLRLDTADLIPAAGLAEFSRRSGLVARGSWDDAYLPREMARLFPGSVARVSLAGHSVLEHPVRTRIVGFGIVSLAALVLFVALLIRPA